MTKEVTFEPVEGRINDLVDEAYRAALVSPMIGAWAWAATTVTG